MSKERKVVITGIGAITPLGLDTQSTWQNMIAGKSGIKRREVPFYQDCAVLNAGSIDNYNPLEYFEKKELRRIHRSAQFSSVTTKEALEDAGLMVDGTLQLSYLKDKEEQLARFGISYGTGFGGGTTIGEVELALAGENPKEPDAFMTLRAQPERVATVVGQQFGFLGPTRTISTACASALSALSSGYDMILRNKADVVVTGGTEASIHRVPISGFNVLRALSKSTRLPEEVSRPFDAEADGFVMSEGSVSFILENEEHAKARGAKIYGYIGGVDETSDAYNDVAPSGFGAERAMKNALLESGLKPCEIDLVSAHATSTAIGDPVELAAITKVYGESILNIPVTATKSLIGHLVGASGGVTLLSVLLAMRDGVIPPTRNLTKSIGEVVDLEKVHNGNGVCRELLEEIDLVPNVSATRKVNAGMANAFGFGGVNVAVVICSY